MAGVETEYLQPVIGFLPARSFKPVTTLWFASLQLLVVISFGIAAILMIFLWPKNSPACEPLYLIMHCHAAFWFIVLIFDHFLKWKHRLLRLDGYLSVSEKMTKYGSLPFFIVSLGTCVMMVVVTVFLQLKLIPLHCTKNEWTSPLIIILGTTLAELSLLGYIILMYMIQVYRFNNVQPVPDVDLLDSWEVSSNLVRDEVGFREQGEVMEELLQKQADLIRHYRDANEVLNKKVMGLTAQIRGDSINLIE